MAGQQTRQTVRDKFFLDFASATAKSSDPFRAQRKDVAIDWLPDVLFCEQELPACSSVATESVNELKALFMQVEEAAAQR